MADPLSRPERPAMAEALRLAALYPRKPTEADRPPLSRFPMTPAARAALELRYKNPEYRARRRGTA